MGTAREYFTVTPIINTKQDADGGSAEEDEVKPAPAEKENQDDDDDELVKEKSKAKKKKAKSPDGDKKSGGKTGKAKNVEEKIEVRRTVLGLI